MPELPEIEVLKRDLEKEVVGRRIKDAGVRPGTNAMKVVSRHGRRKEIQELLEGAKIERVDRSGRRLLLELDNDRTILIALGPNGLLLKTSATEEIAPHTHIMIEWTIGGHLRLIDPDKASDFYVCPTDELAGLKELQKIAIDPLDPQNPLTWQHFSALLEERAEEMKKLMMDENFILGLGDIYSDEILWTAAIRYDRKSNDLSSQDVRRLYRALVEILMDAIKARGTTWGEDGFRDLHGDKGTFQNEIKVFERAGEPCRRCRSPLEKAKVSGSYTYFCPQCQV
jgi:formamidopyrimidine-DNA glycosylase